MSLPSFNNDTLTLIIRFSVSLPDLNLPITSPQLTTPTTLATLTRPHLPPDLSSCPLRYIYAGALLPPSTPLSTSLRLSKNHSQLFYLHCAITTTSKLSAVELERETEAAQELAVSSRTEPSLSATIYQDGTNVASTAGSELLGFDRLLSAGFTPTEVASLRSQFLAIQSHTHTPDTMPSGSELRLLEERWLDSNNPIGGAGVGGDEGDGSFAGGTGGLEDMLWGNIMGFFWAVGAIVWLVREEGIWSKRRQIGVVTGVLVNLAFCVLRAGS